MQNYINKDIVTHSDVLSDVQIPLFFDSGDGSRRGNTLNVLSLFSGCGGMDLGFEGNFICHRKSVASNPEWILQSVNENWVLLKKNRFKTIFANDILRDAQKTWVKYMSRFEYQPDIYHQESIVDLVKLHQQGVKIFPENVDVVTGGFPCQDFSVAGKRKGLGSMVSHNGIRGGANEATEENRGMLYYWMKQVIDIVKPKIFIAENVKGLVSLGDVKSIIQQDFASADGNDYIVLDPQILDAGNYGVPETRERVIFVGIRRSALNETAKNELEKICVSEEYNPYPSPTHNHSANNNDLPAPVTCKDVFDGLKEPADSMDLSQRHYSMAKYMGKHCQGQNEININGLGPTIRSEHHGNIEYRRLSIEHGGRNEEELSMGLPERRLTPRECALIQTFPPDYPFVFYKGYSKRFEVSPSGAYKVIGNAVPPMLAYNIANRLENIWSKYFD